MTDTLPVLDVSPPASPDLGLDETRLDDRLDHPIATLRLLRPPGDPKADPALPGALDQLAGLQVTGA